jgi:hypothetical protein
MGGITDGDLRFCSDRCHEKSVALAISEQVPADVLAEYVKEVHQGRCPKCGGPGPVDVYHALRIWSVLVLTSFNSQSLVGCRSCGVWHQAGGFLFSLVLGWWGLPWGIIMTPVQLVRNIAGMLAMPDSSRPSAELEHVAKLELAAQMLEAGETDNPKS